MCLQLCNHQHELALLLGYFPFCGNTWPGQHHTSQIPMPPLFPPIFGTSVSLPALNCTTSSTKEGHHLS